MDFDFDRDIGSLRGRHFGGHLGFTSREGGYFTDRGKGLASLVQANNRAVLDRKQARNADLSYERGRLELEEAKRARKRERQALQLIPQVSGQLDAIFADPNSSILDKSRAYTKILADNPSLTKTPEGQAVLAAYSNRLALEDAAAASKAKSEAEAKKQETEAALAQGQALIEANASPRQVQDHFSKFYKKRADGTLDGQVAINPDGTPQWDDPNVEGFVKAAETIGEVRSEARKKAAEEANRQGGENAASERSDELRKSLQTFVTTKVEPIIPMDYDETKGAPPPFKLPEHVATLLRSQLRGLGIDPTGLDDKQLFDRASDEAFKAPTSGGGGGRPLSAGFDETE